MFIHTIKAYGVWKNQYKLVSTNSKTKFKYEFDIWTGFEDNRKKHWYFLSFIIYVPSSLLILYTSHRRKIVKQFGPIQYVVRNGLNLMHIFKEIYWKEFWMDRKCFVKTRNLRTFTTQLLLFCFSAIINGYTEFHTFLVFGFQNFHITIFTLLLTLDVLYIILTVNP